MNPHITNIERNTENKRVLTISYHKPGVFWNVDKIEYPAKP